jgi:hypothetical protein
MLGLVSTELLAGRLRGWDEADAELSRCECRAMKPVALLAVLLLAGCTHPEPCALYVVKGGKVVCYVPHNSPGVVPAAPEQRIK